METGGVRLFPFLPGFGSFLDPPASASASAACCRSGQRSLPSLLPVAIHVDLWLARARPTRPRRRYPEQAEPLAPRCACPPTSPISFSRIRLRGANDGEAAAAPCRLARARGTLRFDTTPIHTASHLSLARLAVLHYIAIAVDRSLFEPPWGRAQGNPLAATGRLHRTMGPG